MGVRGLSAGGASLSVGPGPVTLALEGLAAYGQAMERLLREGEIRMRWEEKELWGLVASMVVAAHYDKDPRGLIQRGVRRLRQAQPVLVAFPVANVSWGGPPIAVGGAVLGSLVALGVGSSRR